MTSREFVDAIKSAVDKHLAELGEDRVCDLLQDVIDRLHADMEREDGPWGSWLDDDETDDDDTGWGDATEYEYDCPSCCHTFTISAEQHEESGGVIKCPLCGNMFDEE